ncbi:hypothetical protein OFDDKENP_00100 [Aeromonas phage B614]|nr:hypothetical protein OFDDKENP_00100 [Aeromonas phage B614]UYD58173.1 hypothetical protein JNEOFJEA_00076 [Aeromonas phage UP87]UYD58536.1 hypothetical protein IPAKJDPM_00193 [Aeromonas phage avDM14-QBC]UYD58751.1 hypothetical protein HNNIDBEH_00158 [Aeromonas phage avDM10-HWA]UYD58945.1 hypothetical protein OFOPOMKI_00095 [Aeromonas phage avDM7-IJDJ]UYD60004.1 hypothetical protein LEHPIFIF_00248 [Aeromonas phage avDM9-HANS]
MRINDHAKEFTRVVNGNVHVGLLSTEFDQVRNTIFWTFPDITEVEIGNSKYFAQDGKIFNATINYNSRNVIMAAK